MARVKSKPPAGIPSPKKEQQEARGEDGAYDFSSPLLKED